MRVDQASFDTSHIVYKHYFLILLITVLISSVIHTQYLSPCKTV